LADFRNDPILQSKIAGTRATIAELSNFNIEDAFALIQRGSGVHQLSGHYASIVPLAVFFSQKYPYLLDDIKIHTSLSSNMGDIAGTAGYDEARNSIIWDPIKHAMVDFQATYGTDIITQNSNGVPKTVDDILHYISTSYSGTVTGGGGGTTVFKRTLKVLSHIFH
jgi:hypothetical protein